ncbi:fimbrial protein [Burkholderia ubonensis]|uniref:fimbrial protein n=1 Tax=Burkholderia ubonensis TaxID=101571 RepID=UPI0012F94639|nr:fimbrial protein [Burkholderia ubonensis]
MSITQSVAADKFPVGAALSNQETGRGNFVSETCKNFNQSFESSRPVIPGLSVGGKVVFDSGVPGLGYTLTINRYDIYFTSLAYARPYDVKAPSITDSVTVLDGYRPGWYSAKVTWVVTQRLASGKYTIPAGLKLGTIGIAKPGFTPGTLPVYAGGGSVTFTIRACKATLPSEVSLPSVVLYSLKEIGATSSGSASFSVGLKCDANVSAYATMTDISNPANTGNVLGLSGDSGATGVGLQLFRNGQSTALGFGPDSSVLGTKNQWLVGTASSSGSTFTIPFVVRYVKTAAEITPGSVSARSSITFSYQ